MAEQNNLEQEVAAIITAGFAGEQPQDTTTQNEQEEKRVIDVDLYRLPNGGVLLLPGGTGNPLDQNAVESTTTTPDKEQLAKTPTIPLTSTEKEQEETSKAPQSAPGGKQRRDKPSYVLVPLFLVLFLLAGTVTYQFFLPLTASADIIITPKTRTLEKTTTFTIATTAHAGQVQGRALPDMSLTKNTTVPATGHGHDDAAQSAGVITFYNSDSNPQTIPAGVTFSVNGVSIVTEASVTIQAAVPPLFGQAIVSAHAIQIGVVGNIPARSINTRCCGSVFVTATNTTPFSGGQDARDYTYIQTSDIKNASQDLVNSVTPQVTSTLSKQLRAGEQLVTPLCTPHTTSSQEPGAEALTVTVSVTQTCSSVAYSLDSLEHVGTALLTQSQNLSSYEQSRTVQVTVNGSIYEQHTAHLQVSLSGTWVYSFSQQELTHFKTQIAGMSRRKAEAILQNYPGVQGITVTLRRLDFRDLLPTNPSNIHIVFIVL